MKQRAYSTLAIKAFDDTGGKRTFVGIASTPSVDRMGDIVEPKGMEISLPTPLLWQHNSREPIGWVTAAKVTDEGIVVECEVASIAEAGKLKDRLDEAWQMLKAQLVRGLSIGFDPIESARIEGTWGYRYLKWALLELSAVTIPANAECSIQSIKSYDQEHLRAASGAPQSRAVVRLQSTPGVTGHQSPKGSTVKTIKEQIEGFEAKRAALAGRMDTLMSKSAEEGRTLDETETQEYDGLVAEVKAVDEHIVRLKQHEATMVAKATAVAVQPGEGAAQAGAQARQGQPVIQLGGNNLPKGTAYTRFALALMRARGSLVGALALAEHNKSWHDQTPEVELVLRTAVAAGTTVATTWAAPLVVYQNMANEFIELLRPQTIAGRIPGVRNVPFNVSMGRTTSGASGSWVGEGLPTPLSKMAMETITLGHCKISTIVVLTKELVTQSNPAAEAIVRDDMQQAIVQYLDQQFIDPSVLASGTTRPAAITYGATSYACGGATIALINADINKLFAVFTAAELDLRGAVFVMRPGTAQFLGTLRTTQDVLAFPGINMMGGTFYGVPVITSNSVPMNSGTESQIFLISGPNVLMAQEGIELDYSEEASLQMDDAPSSSASSVVSLWQSGLVGLRATMPVNYRLRRTAAACYIDSVTY